MHGEQATIDPCAGHKCDQCAICQSGSCCGEDARALAQIQPGAWDGPIYGTLGVLATDGDTLQCHICGEWKRRLGSHVWKAHAVTVREYKAFFGLRQKTPLASEAVRAVFRERSGPAVRAAGPGDPTTQVTPEQRRVAHTGRPEPLESSLDPAIQARRQEAARHMMAVRQERGDKFIPPDATAAARGAAKSNAIQRELWEHDPAAAANHGARVRAGLPPAQPWRVPCAICGVEVVRDRHAHPKPPKTCSPACATAWRAWITHTRRVTDSLWAQVAPLLPAPPDSDGRLVLAGLLWALAHRADWTTIPPGAGLPSAPPAVITAWQEGPWAAVAPLLQRKELLDYAPVPWPRLLALPGTPADPAPLGEALWAGLAPLVPADPPKGRPEVPPRLALAAILWVLATGRGWEGPVPPAGGINGRSALRRLERWHHLGVWPALQARLQAVYPDGVDWERLRGVLATLPAPAATPPPPRPVVPPRVSDALWGQVAALLPPPTRQGGVADRAALDGILWVLIGGQKWERLPPEYGSGSGRSCYRRWREWQAAGIWPAIRRLLVAALGYPLPA